MRDAIFQDRVDAGRQLADAVMREVGHPLPLVLALRWRRAGGLRGGSRARC